MVKLKMGRISLLLLSMAYFVRSEMLRGDSNKIPKRRRTKIKSQKNFENEIREKNINLVQVATQKHKRILKKSKKKGKIFHKKDDIPLLSILSIGTIPYLMIPRPSIANVTDLDPDCACSAGVSYKNYYKGINSKSSMDIMEKKYNFEERLAEETEENDDGESNIFPIQLINAEDINETYCRCQCFCDNFELFAVFRNVTNGNWSNNENVGVPDKISNMEPNCGCIDVGPYIVSALPEETINLTPSSSPTK